MCPRPEIVSDDFAGEMVCGRCGVILLEKIPDGNSPRKEQEGKIVIRNLASVSLNHRRSMVISRRRSAKEKRMIIMQRNVISVLEKIGAGGIISDEALEIATKSVNLGIVWGYECFALAAVASACRMHGRYIPEDVLVGLVPGVTAKKMRKAVKKIMTDLNKNGMRSADRIERIIYKRCSEMRIANPIKNKSIAILRRINDYDIAGFHPNTIATAILHMASNGKIPMARLTSVCGISMSSIINATKRISKSIG